jgi:hypothetical protein
MTDFLGPLRAEWFKVLRNYKINTFLVWILPVGTLAFYSLMILGGLLLKAPPQELTFGCGGQWTDHLYQIWNFLLTGEGSIFGRILPLAFCALVFAGEYQWGTWKNLVPRSRRWWLILGKSGAALLAVSSSILITAPISAGGQALLCRVGGSAFGPALGSFSPWEVLGDFTLHCLIGVFSLGLVLGFASLMAVLTRSVLGGFLGGFGLSLLEILSPGILNLLGNLLQQPGIASAYRFLPAFQIENLGSWFFNDQPFQSQVLGLALAVPAWQSLALLVAWAIAPLLLTLALFQGQDLTC